MKKLLLVGVVGLAALCGQATARCIEEFEVPVLGALDVETSSHSFPSELRIRYTGAPNLSNTCMRRLTYSERTA